MDNIGYKIRKLRKENEDNQKELGDKIGYSYGGIAKIERGERKASIEMITKIANVYGVPISYFIGEDQKVPSKLTEDADWITFIDEMEERDISPEEIRQVIEFMDKFKK